jgi:DNA repair protein RadC
MKKSTCIAEIQISYVPAIAEKPIITGSVDAFAALEPFFPKSTIALQEQFVCMYLNRANRVLGVFPVSIGGISSTVADVRLILSVALKTAASSIILAHNHPSGNLEPSVQDKYLTERIKKAADLIEVSVQDHLVLAPNRKYFSFSDEGLL